MEINELLQERGQTHGDYSEFANLSQMLKYFINSYRRDLHKVLSAEHQESLDMICGKIARIVTGDPNVKDHWDDIAGYATLGSKSIKDTHDTGREGTAQVASKKECTCQSVRTTQVSTTSKAGWETAKQA